MGIEKLDPTLFVIITSLGILLIIFCLIMNEKAKNKEKKKC